MQLVLFSLGTLYTALGVLAAILVPLALLATRSRHRSAPGVPLAAAVFMAAWLAASAALASAGAFQTSLGGVPTIAFALAIPITLGLGAVWLIRPIGVAFRTPDLQPLLIAMQSYRIAGRGFIALMVLGQLPAIFAIPAGLGDLAIGLTALGAASAARDGQLSRAIWWNVLGLMDLALALTLGVGTGPSQFGFIATMPRSTLFSLAPLAVVPSFIVPLDISLHLLSLRGLLRRRGQPAVERPLAQLAAA
jgi:hypothetical protein